MRKILLSCSALLLLSGCVSQEKADTKMAAGCEAGINALIKPVTLSEIKSKNFSNEETSEGMHRRITIEAVAKDGWKETTNTYSCLFAQQWGLFRTSHAAILMQIKKPDGKIIGKKDGQLVGSMQDFLNLTGTVNGAMAE